MTVAAPPDPILPPRRRPWGILLLIVVLGLAVAWLAFSSVGNALVYYRTPTELAALDDPVGQTMRLGGLVKQGSVEGPATDLTFILTDGETEVRVHSTVAPTRSFRDGSGAVVEGTLTEAGVFEATQVIVKHDENYEVPPSGELPADQVVDPGQEAP